MLLTDVLKRNKHSR